MSTVQQSHSESDTTDETAAEDTAAENTAEDNAPAAAEQSSAAEKAASSSSAGRTKKSPSAFRTISEVADELGVQQHVLRFWETKFTQVKPLKRGGGRRYYRPEDVALLQKIHHLLYTEGYTIKGVQKLLKGQGKQQILSSNIGEPANEQQPAASGAAPARPGLSSRQRTILESMLGDLKDLRDMLKGEDE